MKKPGLFNDLKKWFTHYPFFKVLALILAVVMYSYVNSEFK
jgi:hypothetical protein